MKFSRVFLITLFLTSGLSFLSCNKKCGSIESSFSGEVISLYDFGDCYIYASVDSNLLIQSDSAFAKYKASHFIHCNSGALASVDFSKDMIIGFKTETHACNAAFHRNIEINNTTKEYIYTVEIEICGGCGTALSSNNFVVAPQLPAGYTIKFISKERQ